MAIQVSGTEVISNARALTNIASVDATTVASLATAGVGGGKTWQLVSTVTTPTMAVNDYAPVGSFTPPAGTAGMIISLNGNVKFNTSDGWNGMRFYMGYASGVYVPEPTWDVISPIANTTAISFKANLHYGLSIPATLPIAFSGNAKFNYKNISSGISAGDYVTMFSPTTSNQNTFVFDYTGPANPQVSVPAYGGPMALFSGVPVYTQFRATGVLPQSGFTIKLYVLAD